MWLYINLTGLDSSSFSRMNHSNGYRKSLKSCRRPTPTALTWPLSTTRLTRPSGTWRRLWSRCAPPVSGSPCPGSTELIQPPLQQQYLGPPSAHTIMTLWRWQTLSGINDKNWIRNVLNMVWKQPQHSPDCTPSPSAAQSRTSAHGSCHGVVQKLS